MIYAKAGNAIKRRAIERLEEFQNGPKMVTLAFQVREVEDDPQEEK